MKTRYSWQETVIAVEERSRVVSTQKVADGSTETFVASEGWFVVTNQRIAYAMGDEKPDIAKGDIIRHTIESVS